MSRETVDRIRRGIEAFNRGDLAAAAEGFDPDIEWRIPFELPDSPPGETYHGREGVIRFWETWRAAFDDFWVELEEIIDAGNQVIVFACVHGRGVGSGAEVKTPTFPQVWTLADNGRPVRVEMFPNRAKALEAVGSVNDVPVTGPRSDVLGTDSH